MKLNICYKKCKLHYKNQPNQCYKKRHTISPVNNFTICMAHEHSRTQIHIYIAISSIAPPWTVFSTPGRVFYVRRTCDGEPPSTNENGRRDATLQRRKRHKKPPRRQPANPPTLQRNGSNVAVAPLNQRTVTLRSLALRIVPIPPNLYIALH